MNGLPLLNSTRKRPLGEKALANEILCIPLQFHKGGAMEIPSDTKLGRDFLVVI